MCNSFQTVLIQWGRRDGHSHSDSYCVTYPYASLSGTKWERAPLYSAWGLARSTGGWTVWGKPLLYDARRWVSEHWVTRHTGVRGRTGLRPRHTRARFPGVRQSGQGRDKGWHQVRLLLQEQTDINSEAGIRGHVDSNKTIQRVLCVEREQQVCYTTTTSYVLAVMYVLLLSFQLLCLLHYHVIKKIKHIWALYPLSLQYMAMKVPLSSCVFRHSNLIKCLMLHL